MQAVKKQVEAKVEARLGIKPVSASAAEAAKAAAKAAAAHEKELAALLRASVKQPKLDPGVDPKSVLCEFFKAGICEKGDKCKFSHDLTIGRKAARVDIYQDKRDEDKIDDWDQAKLESVVKTKHGGEKMQTKTDIVCIYFLDALEKELYGWFWECPVSVRGSGRWGGSGLDAPKVKLGAQPMALSAVQVVLCVTRARHNAPIPSHPPTHPQNGGAACKYRHCLPPGYVFKTKKEREAEAAAKAALGDKDSNLEELIELERAKLPTTGACGWLAGGWLGRRLAALCGECPAGNHCTGYSTSITLGRANTAPPPHTHPCQA